MFFSYNRNVQLHGKVPKDDETQREGERQGEREREGEREGERELLFKSKSNTKVVSGHSDRKKRFKVCSLCHDFSALKHNAL